MSDHGGYPVRWGAIAYAALLALVSALPGGPSAPGAWDRLTTPTLQNALHAPAYALLALLVGAGWAEARRSGRSLVLLSVACAAYGLALEAVQAVVPGRTASLADAAVNALGAVAGAAILLLIRPAVEGRAS